MEKNKGSIDPYHMAGPFGEVLWYLLREFKVNFIERVVAYVKGERKEQLVRCIRDRIKPALQFLNDTAYRKSLSKHIKDFNKLELSKEGLTSVSVSVTRSVLLDDYLSELEKIDELNRLLSDSIWPYYFTKEDYANKQYLITWMPDIQLLRLKNASSYLYPSIYHHLEEENAVFNRPFFNEDSKMEDYVKDYKFLTYVSLKNALHAGNFNLGNCSKQVGHVQEYIELPDQYRFNFLEEAQTLSRWSDYFFLNFSGLLVNMPGTQEAKGRLFLCSPVQGQVLDIAAALFMDSRSWDTYAKEENDRLERGRTSDIVIGTETQDARLLRDLVDFTRKVWSTINGNVVADSISRQFQLVAHGLCEILENEDVNIQRKKELDDCFEEVAKKALDYDFSKDPPYNPRDHGPVKVTLFSLLIFAKYCSDTGNPKPFDRGVSQRKFVCFDQTQLKRALRDCGLIQMHSEVSVGEIYKALYLQQGSLFQPHIFGHLGNLMYRFWDEYLKHNHGYVRPPFIKEPLPIKKT